MKIALLPARGGSRRIPRKNIKLFFGKPIIAYSIETARESGLFDEIWVTTEDPEIRIVAEHYGAKVLIRAMHLAQDEVGTQEVAREALLEFHRAGLTPVYCCVIYATAPLMQAKDLQHGFELLVANARSPYVYSCALKPQRDKGLRWDAGQWYWGPTASFLTDIPLEAADVLKLVIPEKRVCDINTPADWARAELLYARMTGRHDLAALIEARAPKVIQDD